jgi:two-component system alkaline phosphatase synthesis response regulator PhoP
MVAVTNIINTLLETNKDFFSKDEIINYIKQSYSYNSLPIIESNGVVINPEMFHVTIDSVNHVIRKKEFELLYYLMSNKNKVMRRYEIIRDVWGTEICVLDRTIDVHIRKLRSKLKLKAIQTNKGTGYVWVEK